MNADQAIHVDGVWKFFGDFPAVRNVSFEVPGNCVLALVGRNGAGKTTLLRMISGLTPPSRGTITIGGAPARSGELGIVGHGQWLYDDLTGEENLRFFGQAYGVADLEAKIGEWLERTALSAFRRSRVSEYSRGMRQRLALARAFLHDPRVLLLDEPWTALDDRAIALLSELVLGMREAGRTVIVCSHQLREAISVADQLVVIDRGKLRFSGPITGDVRGDPDNLYEKLP